MFKRLEVSWVNSALAYSPPVMAPYMVIRWSFPARESTSTLMALEWLSISAGCTGAVAKVLCDPKLWMVHACLALLGGTFQVRQLFCWSCSCGAYLG